MQMRNALPGGNIGQGALLRKAPVYDRYKYFQNLLTKLVGGYRLNVGL